MNTLAIDQEMLNGSVDAGFVLALPFHHRDLEPDCVGVSKRGTVGAERRTRGGEMLLTLALGASSASTAEEAGPFREVAGVSIVAAGAPRS